MIKDIDFKKIEGIAMAVIQRQDEEGEYVWKVYLLNLKNTAIESVLIRSRGYGEKDSQEVKTSELRQFFERIEPQEYVEVEILPEELLRLHNQFWISFSHGGFLYDKKYVFLAETIRADFFTEVPLLNEQGVMIK